MNLPPSFVNIPEIIPRVKKEESVPPLQALQKVEEKVIKLLELAAKTCQRLGLTDATQQESLQELCEEYMLLLEEIQSSLRNHLRHLINNNPYRNSITIYGTKQDLELANMKTAIIQKLLLNVKQSLPQPNNDIIPLPLDST